MYAMYNMCTIIPVSAVVHSSTLGPAATSTVSYCCPPRGLLCCPLPLSSPLFLFLQVSTLLLSLITFYSFLSALVKLLTFIQLVHLLSAVLPLLTSLFLPLSH
jgi:hypothetical protein